MLSNSQIKHILSLRQKKFRLEHQQFVVEGIKVVKELLASDVKTLAVYVLADAADEFRFPGKIEPEVITPDQLGKMSSLETPNKVIALAEMPKQEYRFAEMGNKLSLGLDTINDPGNLGTIIRTAAWFGIEHIICSENTADIWNSKTVQASMGAVFRTSIVYHDLKNVVVDFKKEKIPVYATTLDGENIYKSDLTRNGLIIIGSESHGVSPDLLSIIERKLVIPPFSKGAAESLNAAVASGIVCSEFKRR